MRLTSDDGHSYSQPAISPNGEFVAYVSDRSGKAELWLQQVGGGDPIQLTHDNEKVTAPAFFPDGKRILYEKFSAGQKSTIEVISTLGGEPTVLTEGVDRGGSVPSQDGRQIAYIESKQGAEHLMTISSSGGQPRELPAWARVRSSSYGPPVWTSDSRYLLCPLIVKPSETANAWEWEWFAFPADGGNPVATGAGAALRAAGFTLGLPVLMTGDRVLFVGVGGTAARFNVWEIRLSPGSWRVRGVPAQLAFGTLNEIPASISATGTVALTVGSFRNDFYLIPLAAATGQPPGVARRLTQDERDKFPGVDGGNPGSAYFGVFAGATLSVYAVDLVSSRQTLMIAGLPLSSNSAISPDGRQVAYSVAEGDSYSIRLGAAGAGSAEAPVLCKACGRVEGFSPDGKFLFRNPEAKVKNDPKRKLTVRLLEVASGKDRPWLEHPTDSVSVADTFDNGRWLGVWLGPPGSMASWRLYLVPWREDQVPQSDWIKTPWSDTGAQRSASPTRNFVYFFEGSKLMAVRFDPQRVSFSEPKEVKFVPGSAMTPRPDDIWTVRGPGLVFSRQEHGNSSVWLMKLPR